MSEERDGTTVSQSEEALPSSGAPAVPMQLFSTWEVRKVPANCVSRLCTLTVTHLEIVHCFVTGPTPLVLAVSMKSPHRFLRSNEIQVPPSGLIDIPLQLTFSLQYPHFLKRGGNVLQIRLQRRKRYRNRPIGGYKTLVLGRVDMSAVMQHSFQGPVRLYSEKATEHLAVVTVGSLTSTAVEMGPRGHLAEVSSEEDEDDIFSDELVERGSDSDSGDNMGQSSFPTRKIINRLKPSSAVLRLLRLSRPSKHGQVELVTALDLHEGEGEDRVSAVTFASSLSESEEEEDNIMGTPPRPILSPFYGSDRCSMVSMPATNKPTEGDHGGMLETAALSRKYGSLEQAIAEGRETMESPPPSFAVVDQYDVQCGRIWVVDGEAPGGQVVTHSLEEVGESVMIEGEVASLKALLNQVERQWHGTFPFSIVLYGGDTLMAAVLQALVSSRCLPDILKFALIPSVPGVVSARVASLDERYQTTFSLDGQWVAALQESISMLMQYVTDVTQCMKLPVAQAMLHMEPPAASPTPQQQQSLPFVCSVSVGSLELEPESLPTSPTYTSSVESPELVVEYWSGKKEKSSVKVRSVNVSCGSHQLNVTAMTRDKKGKGIRIRKKEADTGGSIVSLTATQLVCKPASKQETVTAIVDGVEYPGVSAVKLMASWEPNRTFPLALCPTYLQDAV